MKFVFWQNIISIHQSAFLNALTAHHELTLVVEKDIEEGKIAKLDVKDIDITMYRQVFYHANKYMTKEMEKFVEYCRL